MRRVPLAVVLAVVACSGRVLAHGNAGGGLHAVLGPLGFLAGVAIAGVAVALDARDAIAPRYADVGVYVGGVLALVGLGVYVVV